MQTTPPANTLRIAQILATIATLFYGTVPVLVDFTESHVFHPDWPAHARFHMVWLLAFGSAIAAAALCSIWCTRHDRVWGLRAGASLGLFNMLGFFTSAATMRLYGGSLNDMGDWQPLPGVDGNLLAFSGVTALLVAALWLTRSAKARGVV